MDPSFRAYFLSVLIGLLVGIEREKAKTPHSAMGVRSFLLMALLGALAGGAVPIEISAVLLVIASALVLISYKATASADEEGSFGLTTELAAIVVFILGYLSHTQPLVSAFLGPLVALFLLTKQYLHTLTEKIKPQELQAVILLLLLGVGVVSLLEDKTIDPWGIFNPHKFGMMVLVLSAFEFFGYVAGKLLGSKSKWLVGFLGGFVSSTAVAVYSSRKAAEQPESKFLQLGLILSAQISSLLSLLAIIAYSSFDLAMKILTPVLATIAFCALMIFILFRKADSSDVQFEIRSPLDFKNIFRLSLILGAILTLAELTQKFFGEQATQFVSFLTGLFELHGTALATTQLFLQKKVSSEIAFQSILIAIFGSLVSKAGISALSKNIFSAYCCLAMTLLATVILFFYSMM